MAYFNHAFKKTFVATNGVSALTGVQLGTSPTNVLAPGEISFIDPKTFQVATTPDTTCCEFILAGGAFMPNDKIGPFHGGYTESNKSKTIKSKYVSRLYRAPGNLPSNYVTHVGFTPWTSANAPDSSKPGETAGECCKSFLCGETYYLRLDVKGSPPPIPSIWRRSGEPIIRNKTAFRTAVSFGKSSAKKYPPFDVPPRIHMQRMPSDIF